MTDKTDLTPNATNDAEVLKESDGTGGTAPLTVEMQEVNKPPEEEKNQTENASNNVKDKSNSDAKRNVSFPTDEQLVCYSEAPDPWKNATLWTTQDLISYYRIGCDQNNVKPLPKVITQLQGIENTRERFEILSLKGEKLDMRHCESLEEIFKRVQFRCVDLEGCHLDNETAVALFDMIEFYESACKVNMSFNRNVSLRGWQACARMVRKTPCLTFLDARNCDLNERLVPVLGRALRMGCFLTTLHLESTYISGRPLVILVAALKMNETLKELFLADNRLMTTDGIQLGNLLKYNHKLSLLDIRNNHLQDIGVGHVCDGVREQNLGTGLQTLVLWNNQLTYSGMSAIGKALSFTESLETLNLGHNNVTNEGIHQMKDGLLKSKSLLRLGLQGTKVTCEGAVALAEVIADSPRLLRLDLRENEIKTAGLMALSLALKVNETVTRLDIDRDTKRESGMKDYVDQQRRLQQDIHTYLERNQVLSHKRTDEERIELERSIKEDTRPKTESFIEPSESDSSDTKYIQTFDKVKRPMLLVMKDKNAQQTLDSPYIRPEDLSEFQGKARQKAISPSIKSVISSTPPGELLLSPQYCDTVKARKLFTVSRVEGTSLLNVSQAGGNASHSSQLNSLSVNSLLSSTDTECLFSKSAVNHSDTLDLNSPANALSQNLEAETVNHMIEELVAMSTGDNNNVKYKEFTQDQNTQSFHQNPKAVSDKPDTVSSCESCLENSATHIDDNSASHTQEPTHCTNIKPMGENHIVSQVICDNTSNGEQSDQITGGLNKTGIGAINSVVSDNRHPVPVGSDVNLDNQENSEKLNCDDSHVVNSKCSDVENVTEILKNLPCEKLKKDEQSRDSGIGSYENEHWTTVSTAAQAGSSLEVVKSSTDVTEGKHRNPDFYSNLTFNGLTQELASALENLDSTETDSLRRDVYSESLSAPDDFERELDQMLADVKSGTHLNLPSNLS